MGDAAGELLFTFHHAIADGLYAMALVQRLFALLAAATIPDLSQAFAGWRPESPAVSRLADRQDLGLSTSYGLEPLSVPATETVIAWTRLRGLRSIPPCMPLSSWHSWQRRCCRPRPPPPPPW